MTQRRATLLVISMICVGIVMISTLGEFIPGLLASVFNEELNTVDEVIGMLVATIFLTSCICSFPAGWLVDRIPATQMLLMQALLAAAAFGSFALAQNSVHLFMTSACIGLVMAFNQPATNRLIITYLAPAQQAAAVGWRSIGVQAGMVLGSLIFAASANWIPWRITISSITTVMIISGILMFKTLRDRTPRLNQSTVSTGSECCHCDSKVGPHGPSTKPITWLMIPYTLLTSGAISALAAYFIVFGTEDLELTLTTASIASGMYAAVSLVARVFWVKRLREDNQLLLLFIASTATAVAFIFLALTPAFGAWAFWVATVLVGATSAGTGPLAQIVTVKNADPLRIGVVSGWVSIGTFGGLMLQPVLFAALISSFGIVGGWIAVTITSMLASITVALFAVKHRWR